MRHLCDWHGDLPPSVRNQTQFIWKKPSYAPTYGFCGEVSQIAVYQMRENQSCEHIFKLFGVYLNYLRQDNGALADFWMSYVDMVEVMLGLIRASRDGDWMLHFASIHAMIPWCFAYKLCTLPSFNYYHAHMSRLAIDHTDLHEQFMKGKGFSVELGKNNPFGSIPVDQATEKTVNKNTQTHGGSKRL